MTEKEPLPSWLKETEQGMSITLKYKATINGITVDKLSMRSPSVRDTRVARELAEGDNAKLELNLFASLTDSHINDLESLTERDYRRLQAGYFRLVSEDEL